MPGVPPPPRFDRDTWLAVLVVAAVASLTYVVNFSYPAVPFWDERYYIVAAQKYLHGVYFIDLHPPLGKLLITLGERLFGQNADTAQFLDVTYYATDIPVGFSFVGFRVFPVLLASLTAPLLFTLFLTIVRDRTVAMLLSGLYVFDNALIVHQRGAMLEGPLLFFTVALFVTFVWLLGTPPAARRRFRRLALVAGVALGCALSTKSIAVVLALLPAVAVWRLRADRRRAIECALLVAIASALVVVSAWEIHFALARHVNPALQEKGYYQTPSPAARSFLESRHRLPVVAFPAMLSEALRYARWYDAARPAIDFCRADEKASPFWMWPIGARAVAYWWDTADNGASFRYLYLQVNPVIWGTALAGLAAAVALLIGSSIAPPARPLKNRFLLTTFTALYCAYFVPFRWIHGVMFLYHYFIPLMISFVLVALVVDEATQLRGRAITPAQKRAVLTIWLVAAFASFWFYKPLTYYERPLTPQDLSRRAIVALWDLRCITCPHADGLCGTPPP
jgi:dolichyl-phosphate-mannose--protein O-mannosyl transferase